MFCNYEKGFADWIKILVKWDLATPQINHHSFIIESHRSCTILLNIKKLFFAYSKSDVTAAFSADLYLFDLSTQATFLFERRLY